MMSELRRRAAFWGNQSGNLDYFVKEFERPFGEKWPDDEDKKAIGELLPVLKKALRLARTRYIGVLMVQTAEEAENAEKIREENASTKGE